MIELMVGMVAVLALTAGLLQVASLSRTHTEVLTEARREAGEYAMLDLNLLFDPDYIRDWEAGEDASRHTRDDEAETGNAAGFRATIVERAGRDDADWAVIGSVPNQGLTTLRQSDSPDSWFGLVEGHREESVVLLPAVRSLLYRAESIDVEATVWMTRTGGMY